MGCVKAASRKRCSGQQKKRQEYGRPLSTWRSARTSRIKRCWKTQSKSQGNAGGTIPQIRLKNWMRRKDEKQQPRLPRMHERIPKMGYVPSPQWQGAKIQMRRLWKSVHPAPGLRGKQGGMRMEDNCKSYRCGHTGGGDCEHPRDCWHCKHSIRGMPNSMGFPTLAIGCLKGLPGYNGNRVMLPDGMHWLLAQECPKCRYYTCICGL